MSHHIYCWEKEKENAIVRYKYFAYILQVIQLRVTCARLYIGGERAMRR